MRRSAAVFALFALAVALAGCASPRSSFYTLSPTASPAPAAAGPAVSVGPVTVPGIVDRPQIVVRESANRVFLDEFHRWGAPLQDDIARVVAGNLSSLLGTHRVTAVPAPEAAGEGYRVLVDVVAFESSPGEAAVLDAVWTVKGRDGRAVRSGRSTVREASPEPGYAALAAAHSRALSRMSAEIAEAIRRMEAEGK